jgi:dTDP-4-dehydrorhamnose reductase
MINILITGANGMLAMEFKEVLEKYKNSQFFQAFYASKEDLDITNIDSVRSYVCGKKIDYILNCAANRNAEQMEEDDIEPSRLITVDGPRNLAIVANELGANLIHFSSDYVFDGEKSTPYTEEDVTNGLSVYGKLKIEGENAVLKTADTALVIRTAWLFSAYGKDFVKTIKYLAETRNEIKVVFDQIGSPCYAADLAHYIIQILPLIKKGTREIYHLTNEGCCSWYDLAYSIVSSLKLNCKVIPIHTSEFPQKAMRPHYSVLDKTKIINDFSLSIRHYSDGLSECIEKIQRG